MCHPSLHLVSTTAVSHDASKGLGWRTREWMMTRDPAWSERKENEKKEPRASTRTTRHGWDNFSFFVLPKNGIPRSVVGHLGKERPCAMRQSNTCLSFQLHFAKDRWLFHNLHSPVPSLVFLSHLYSFPLPTFNPQLKTQDEEKTYTWCHVCCQYPILRLPGWSLPELWWPLDRKCRDGANRTTRRSRVCLPQPKE